jgi:hypothetical protein
MSNVLIFGDSISRGAFDLEKAGWTNRLMMFCWQENFKKQEFFIGGRRFILLPLMEIGPKMS